MRRALAVTALSLALAPAALLLAPAQAEACSCMRAPGPVVAAQGSDAVFTAKLVSSKDVPKAQPNAMATKIFTFEVQTTFKGQLDAQVNINTADNSAACGRTYGEPGSEWLIYAKINDEGQARDNLCSRTMALADAAEDIKELEANADELDKPAEPAPDPVEPAEPEPDPVLPPADDGANPDEGPEPAEPSKKGCAVAEGDLGAGGLAGLLGLGLVLGWRRRRA